MATELNAHCEVCGVARRNALDSFCQACGSAYRPAGIPEITGAAHRNPDRLSLAQTETPEAHELLRKLAELESIENTLTERELELATLGADLRAFEGRYARLVGVLIAELDQLEAAIAERRHRVRPEDADARAEVLRAQARARESARSTQVASQQQGALLDEGLKALYRQVARQVHPDLATDDAGRALRTAWMARVNSAYDAGDRTGLESLLRDWAARPESVPGDSVGAQLVRTIRKIAQVRTRIEAIAKELATLRKTDLCQLRDRVQEAELRGQHLLAEMAARVASKIVAAEATLKSLDVEQP